MTDVVSVRSGRLVDVLGTCGHVRVALSAVVRHGVLELRSTAVGVGIAGVRLRLPAAIAPRVHLSERYDEANARQYVEFTLDAPLIGRL